VRTVSRLLLVVVALTPAPARARPYTFPLHIERGRLLDARGHGFFYQADSAPLLLLKLERDEAVEFLRDRRIRGFSAVESALTLRGARNHEGALPFGDDDLARPEPRYFEAVDQVARTMEALGLLFVLRPLDTALDRDPTRCQALGRWLGDRFHRFGNIMWALGGDDPPSARPCWAALARGLAENAPHHLVAGRPGDPWDQVVMVPAVDPALCRAGPCVLAAPADPESDPRAVRTRAYQSVLAGAAGYTYASSVRALPPAWRAQLGGPGSATLIHVRTLLDGRPWELLEPDPKLAGAAAAARARDGSFALVYLPGPQLLRVDARRLAGPRANAWWWNPRTGEHRRAGVLATTGSFPLRPPSAAPTDDWVLLLDDASRKFRPPGDDPEPPGPAQRSVLPGP
jgi:hypothetical protein